VSGGSSGGSSIDLADAPAVAGLRFRTCRGPEDAAELTAVLNADSAAAGIDEHATDGELAADLSNADDEDPTRTLVIAEIDGRVVAYARRSYHDRRVFHAYEHVGYDHPGAGRRGIGRALLRHQAAALAERAAAAARQGERVLFTWADERRVGATALIASEGYTPVRWYADMARATLADLPPPTVPAGIDVRRADPSDPAGLRELLASEDEAFRDAWGHHDMSPTEMEATLAEPDLDAARWLVARDGDRIAGLVRPIVYAAENARFGRDRVWIDHLSVRRPWRGRGLGTALLVAALEDARVRGLTSAALGVDTDSATGALQLYERLGFVRGRVTVAWAKPLPAAPTVR
jgi:mycothiol synthase